MQFETLPGFRDFLPESCSARNAIFDRWRSAAVSFHFLEYDAPVLEPLNLYIEKSGEEIVGQLFNFTDRGDRAVALRPEMTPTLARLVGARANSLKRPVKWFNIGEHYRYERPQKGRLRAFYQLNADILGEPGPGADAELIALLVQTLRSFGLGSEDFAIRLSDRNLWWLILEAEGLSPESALQVLGIIDKMERMDRARMLEKLTEVVGFGADGLCSRIDAVKSVSDFAALESLVSSLSLNDRSAEAANARLEDWRTLLDLLGHLGAADSIRIDLSIVRGLAYYTGFVFEAFEASGAGRALAGGGRYDDLVEKLGGPAMPAVGFAMGDVTLADLLRNKSIELGGETTPDFTIVIGGVEERPLALEDAASLRALGLRVEYPLKEQNFGKQLKSAVQGGASFALIYGSEERLAGVIKVRDLKTATEAEIPRDRLVAIAPKLLTGGLKSISSEV
ncbi:MAG: histidine--tRNA ligase [Coraliomargaritaceae bacterium]